MAKDFVLLVHVLLIYHPQLVRHILPKGVATKDSIIRRRTHVFTRVRL